MAASESIIASGISPTSLKASAILCCSAITSFDLVRALTGGGPGISTMLPTLVVYDFMFQRSELGRGCYFHVPSLGDHTGGDNSTEGHRHYPGAALGLGFAAEYRGYRPRVGAGG